MVRLFHYWLLLLFETFHQVQCLEWSVALSGPGPTRYEDVTFDKAGNIVALGFMIRTNDNPFVFYNKSSVPASNLSSPDLSLLGSPNIMQVLNPEGDLLSTMFIVAQSCIVTVGKLAIDSHSNRIMSCPFTKQAYFLLDDARTQISTLQGTDRMSCFLVKMTRFNQASWSARVFSTNDDADIGSCIVSVSMEDDSVYLLASAGANIPVTMMSRDGTSVNFQGHATGSSLLVKYSENGFVQWFRTMTSSTLRDSNLINFDQLGNLIWVGAFENQSVLYSHSVSQNIQTPIVSFNSSGGKDGFVFKFSADGDFIWCSIVCGDDNEEVVSAVVDSENNVVVSGHFRSNNTVFRYLNNTQSSIVSKNFVADDPPYTYWGGFVAKFTSNGSILWVTNQTFGLQPALYDLQNMILSSNRYNSVAVTLRSTQYHHCNDASGSRLILPRGGAVDSYIVEYDKNGNFISHISLKTGGHDYIQRAAYNSYGETVYGGASINPTFRLSPKYEWTFSNGYVNAFLHFTKNQVAYVDFFRRNQNWICFARVMESSVDILSNEVPKLTNSFPTRLVGNNSKSVVIGCSVSRCFVSVDGSQLDAFSRHPFYVGFSDTNIEQVNNSTECRSLQHELGLISPTGTFEDGTYVFEMEEQHGYLTNLPLNEVEDRSNVTLSFRLVLLEDSFTIGLDTTSDSINVVFNSTGTLRVSAASNSTIIQTQSITQDRFSIIVESSQLSLINGNTTFWSTMLVNGSLSRLSVTSRGKSVVESMFLNVRRSSVNNPSDTSSLIEPTSTYEASTYITETFTQTNSDDGTGPKRNEFSIFGLSGIILYLSMGGAAFVLVSFIGTAIYFVRKRMLKKKSYDYEGVVTSNVTASSITGSKHEDGTLINSTSMATSAQYNRK